MTNYWLHRISHEAQLSYPLLKENWLSIGFSDFAFPDFLKQKDNLGRNEWDDYFEKQFKELWGCLPRSRYSLWYFLTDMKPGDYVLVPGNGVFSVFKIEGEPKLLVSVGLGGTKTTSGCNVSIKRDAYGEEKVFSGKNPELIDLGFVRCVKPIAQDISRAKFAKAQLTSRMKIRKATANISTLKDSVQESINSFQNNSPINLYASIKNKIVPDVLASIRDNLGSDKLEKLVEWYLRRV